MLNDGLLRERPLLRVLSLEMAGNSTIAARLTIKTQSALSANDNGLSTTLHAAQVDDAAPAAAPGAYNFAAMSTATNSLAAAPAITNPSGRPPSFLIGPPGLAVQPGRGRAPQRARPTRKGRKAINRKSP